MGDPIKKTTIMVNVQQGCRAKENSEGSNISDGLNTIHQSSSEQHKSFEAKNKQTTPVKDRRQKPKYRKVKSGGMTITKQCIERAILDYEDGSFFFRCRYAFAATYQGKLFKGIAKLVSKDDALIEMVIKDCIESGIQTNNVRWQEV